LRPYPYLLWAAAGTGGRRKSERSKEASTKGARAGIPQRITHEVSREAPYLIVDAVTAIYQRFFRK